MNNAAGHSGTVTYHVISHTHWDREWYLTFEQFRYRLVKLIDRLLELLDRDPNFAYFHLDGQTIVLEDYYALRPGNRDRLETYIRQGKIIIGPWYQQNDLFLTSGESTVRNLMRGIADSRRLGGEMKVGYLPDHFGLLGQMPQLFRQVGIDNAVFGRGYETQRHRGPLFRWEAPDGTAVTGIHLYHWYNSAQRLPAEEAALQNMFALVKEREHAVHQVPHYALMNGVDHLEAQYDLTTVLEKLNTMTDKGEAVIHGTLAGYVEGIQSHMNDAPPGTYETVKGELREGYEYSILSGTLSSRIYLKQANARGHDLLEKWLEPLSAFCAAEGLEAYDADALNYGWQLYMENHPHDSICGCSQDAVHEHMMDRYRRLEELGEDMLADKLKLVARQISSEGLAPQDQKLVVFNMSQAHARQVISSEISFLERDGVKQFAIEDDEGRSVPYRIVSVEELRKQVLSPVNLPGIIAIKQYRIEWEAEAAPLGYAAYRIMPHKPGAVLQDGDRDRDRGQGHEQEQEQEQEPRLENDYLRVDVRGNGSMRIVDKLSGRTYMHAGGFENSGDQGDLYVYKEVPGEAPLVWNGEVKITGLVRNHLYEECRYEFQWLLPEDWDARTGARSKRLVPYSFEVAIRLDRHATRINMKIKVDNRAKDHRIRLLLPLDCQPDYVAAGGQFDVVKRAWDEGMAFERDAYTHPFWKWVAPVKDGKGLAVFAKGLHEYECIDEGMTAAVTLHRGVETIFMREAKVLKADRQPKGQCLGPLELELAIRPFSELSMTALYQEAEQFHQGLRDITLPVDEEEWSKGRPWVQDAAFTEGFKEEDPNLGRERLPWRKSFLRLEGEAMVSAIKMTADGTTGVIRLFNAEEQLSPVSVHSEYLGEQAYESNLLEEQGKPLVPGEGILKVELAAKRIATYLVGVRGSETK